MRLKMALLLVLLFVLPSISTRAQENNSYSIIYINDAGEVIALDSVTGEQRVLMSVASEFSSDYGFNLAGDHLAIFVRRWDQAALNNGLPSLRGFRLYVVTVSSGEILLDQDLLPGDFTETSDGILGDPRFELTRALGEVIWSPDGRYVAFVSGQAGTADVFAFDTVERTLMQLENGGQTAALLHWLPDSSGLLYNELETFGTGAGYTLAGFYQVDLAGNVTSLELPPPADMNGISLLGWLNDTTFLYAPQNFIAGASGLHAYDLSTQTATEYIRTAIELTVPVFDPVTQQAVFVAPELSGLTGMLVPGVYAWRSGDDPQLLQSGTFYFAEYVRAGLFQVESPNGSLLYDGNSLRLLPPSDFGTFVSPSADVVALYRSDGVYASNLNQDDASLVWAGEAQIPVWSPDGTKFYTFGNTPEGAGLVELDLVNRGFRLLDSRMAITSRIVVSGQ